VKLKIFDLSKIWDGVKIPWKNLGGKFSVVNPESEGSGTLVENSIN